MQAQIDNSAGLTAINDAKVAQLVALRRQDGVSNATVNRSVIEPLRGIMLRAVNVWKQQVDMPDWKRHALKEVQERIRELSRDEEARYFDALRLDYHPVIGFSLLSGCRLQKILDLE